MKKIINIILFTVTIFLTPSCGDDFLTLSDPDAFEINKFYKTETDMDAAVTGAYISIRRAYDQLFYVTEMRSDNATTLDYGSSGGVYYSLVNYTYSSNTSFVSNIWNRFYNTIYRSNLVLKYINNVPMNEEKRTQLIAEAKFLRALSHFYLVRLYGEIPVVDHVIDNKVQALETKRQPIMEAYNLIISDLKFVAESNLPEYYDVSNKNYGRVTKSAGAAVLGKVYVTMASQFDDKDYYNDAKKYLEQAYDIRPFTDLSTIAFGDVFNLDKLGSKEVIFQVLYRSGIDNQNSLFAQTFQPQSQKNLTSQFQGKGHNLGDINLYDEYEKKGTRAEIRRDLTMKKFSDIEYYTVKYIDMSDAQGRGGNPWIEIRYADVILLLAETYEQLSKPTEAISYLNIVRTRAKLDKYENMGTDYKEKYPTLRDAIFHERRIELAFENHRWFDLLRYKKGNDLVEYMQAKGGNYRNFGTKDFLLPIPYDERQLNPENYPQNPGY